ncbi:RNA helicase, variant 2 [Entomophthora muscae]|nr:RNA helicase, variant 2 [Entomophthora muscae]
MLFGSNFVSAGQRLQLTSVACRSTIVSAVAGPRHNFSRASSNASFVSTKKLLDRYSKKSIDHKPRKDYSAPNKSIKGKEDVRVASAMIGHSNSLKNLKSEEDPNFKKLKFNSCVSTFQGNHDIPKLMKSIGIEKGTYYKYLESFCRDIVLGKIRNATYSDCVKIHANQGSFGVERHLLTTYLSQLMPLLSHTEKKTLDFFLNMTDLSNPAASYPKARRMQRKIIMHVGPTNSGKTYRALEKLKSSNKGIYCGPLRLLAYEVWKRFIDQGLPCDLITGEERISAAEYFADPSKFSSMESKLNGYMAAQKPTPKESPFFHSQRLVSATTEMLSVNELYDIAVIDEIQLLGDQQRGWAWARALLGVQAHEIHLCGEASAVPIVKDICRELNEEVEVNEYKRLSPLEVSSTSLKGLYHDIQEGDCFVAFSRNSIFKHKSAIESITGLKCAVVYGKLPPENRAQQARLFNDPNSPYKVMVASDAVGMGLNL